MLSEMGPNKMTSRATLDVAGKKVDVTNLHKVFYPKIGFTKGQVINYYIKISPVLLPHLKDRPLSLKRYPNGVDGKFFYEKRCPVHRPGWLETIKVATEKEADIHYCAMNSLPALVWAANLADLELHTFLHKAPALKRPTAIAFDLDPGAPASIVECYQVGLWIKAIFDCLGLQCFPKTSGSKGLQIYVPLNTAITYPRTKAFARAIAELLEKNMPNLVVSQMKKEARVGKVFVDWGQNDEMKTTVNVYSLRAMDRPTVSTPLAWTEVAGALERKEILSFEVNGVLQRVAEMGDLFAPVLTLKQKLPSITLLNSGVARRAQFL